MTLTAGSAVQLPVRVANLGAASGARSPSSTRPAARPVVRPRTPRSSAGGCRPANPLKTTDLPPAIEPGATVEASVAVLVPRTPGVHTLLLDLVTPDGKSLMAAGVGPTLVRITAVAPR